MVVLGFFIVTIVVGVRRVESRVDIMFMEMHGLDISLMVESVIQCLVSLVMSTFMVDVFVVLVVRWVASKSHIMVLLRSDLGLWFGLKVSRGVESLVD